MQPSLNINLYTTTKPALPFRAQIPQRNVGQVAHISPTHWVTSQEADITGRALEVACWLRLGCWSNNSGAFNRRILRSCLVPQCSYPLHRPLHQRRLTNCDWMPASKISEQPSNPRRHPIYWALSQWSHTVSSTSCHGAWTPAPLSAHPSFEGWCTAAQIETPNCSHRKTTHQFIWQQQRTCSALGGSPMEFGVGGQPHKTSHFHPRHWHPPARNEPPMKSLGPASPPPHRCRAFLFLLFASVSGLLFSHNRYSSLSPK